LNSKGFKKDKIIRNLIISNSIGQLFIYGTSPNLKDGRECEVINSHVGSINCLKVNHDSSILVSAGSDGIIIVY
jgi:WD40 repeat protein